MKKAIIVVMALLSLSLVGCGKNNSARFTEIESGKISTGTRYVIMYDNETNVEYIRLKGNNTGISPLYNADGTLIIYKGE